MKRLLTLGLAVMALGAGAADLRLTLDRIADRADVANGSTNLAKFDKTVFSAQDAVYRMTRNRPSTRYCKFQTATSTKAVFSALKEQDAPTASAIGSLHQSGKILFMVYRGLTEGESESCSFFSFDIYTKDGYRLSLDYDRTT
jgi:hypothetical protein